MIKHGRILVSVISILLFCSVNGLIQKKWTADTFPNPSTDVEKCNPLRNVPSWICDPDQILSKEGADVIEGVIKLIASGEQPYVRVPCGNDGYQGFEVGVAIMKQFRTMDGDEARTAEKMAQALHAKWGVGRAACQNGVLLLLAIENRQVYISTGAGTQQQLTWSVLGDIIDEAKPYLKQKRFDDAVQHAVVNIGLALAGKPIEQEEEETDWVGIGIMTAVVGALGFVIIKTIRDNMRMNRRYKNCRTLLDRIKRDQAALQGGAYAVTSCPICLEELQPEAQGGTEGDSTTQASGEEGPSTCTANTGDEKEPLISSKGDDGAGTSGTSTSAAVGTNTEAKEPPLRRPLVLPCGHVFCEQCLGGWIDQRKTSCPICRRDMDSDDSNKPPPPPPNQPCQVHQQEWEQDFPQAVLLEAAARSSARPVLHLNNVNTNRWRWRGHGPYTVTDLRQRGYGGTLTQEQAQEVMRQDLLFRLQALRRRYPEYVTQDMVRTWGEDVSSGRELSASALRAFQLNDPTIRRELAHHGSSGASTSFGGGMGGGRSGGGRGGSW